ncbi:MAG: signal peptide peptidase SppA [Paludibacter sp.]|nr:signal peptide peptidase SppA [Paludibacter sp.]
MKYLLKVALVIFISLFVFQNKCEAKRVKPNSVYVLKLDGPLLEYKGESSFSDKIMESIGLKANNSIGLNQILKNIRAAKYNPRIEGIYLKGGKLLAGWASIQEIRDALIDFKSTGKFIYAYADEYSQSNYYLVSVADRIMLNPYGTIDLKGLSSSTTFYKNGLDKLGVKFEVVKVGSYKSAPEPFTEDSMSTENREQLTEMLNSMWKTIDSGIAVSRKISSNEVDSIADLYAALLPSQDLKSAHLIDTLVYADEIDSIVNKLSTEKPKFRLIGHESFTRINRNIDRNKNKIAVIYANGDIGGSRNGIDAQNIARICRGLARNSSVKAVVLRVNSPGGSAFDSEKIWRSLSKLKEKKPLVVSMGNYAASGGYYISCMADKIIAEPTTITGSIGIFGMFPDLSKLNQKIGLTTQTIKTNKMGDAYSVNRPFAEAERKLMQENVDRGYDLFVKRCADGRKKTVDEINAIAGGHVWSGEKAKEIGLVDEIGGLFDAVKIAGRLAGCYTYQLMVPQTEKRGGSIYLTALKQKLSEEIIQQNLGSYYDIFQKMNDVQNLDKIQAKSFIIVDE